MPLKPFQIQDYARAALHDGLILAHDTGLGKGIAALVWPLLKVGWTAARLDPDPDSASEAESPSKARSEGGSVRPRLTPRGSILIVAPGGLHEQIRAEAKRVLGLTLTSLDSQATFKRLVCSNGKLSNGFYLTSYTQLGVNGSLPIGPKPKDGDPDDRPRNPTLADLCADTFDCVVIDEGTRLKGADTLIAEGVRTLRPKYRLVLTATPIKNRIPDFFYLAWCAAGGHDKATARFPYSRDDQAEFAATFSVSERNLTKEAIAMKLRKPSRFVKLTNQVCNIHRFWKLNGPITLRRRKADAGEQIPKKIRRVLRVPLGTRQAEVYKRHLDWKPKDKHGKPAIGAQLQALRIVASAPSSTLLPFPNRYLSESLIPKQSAALTLIAEILERGEQVIVFSAFHDPLDDLQRRLRRAGVRHYLLDGRLSEAQRGNLAAQFKKGPPPRGSASPLEHSAFSPQPFRHVPVLLASTECMSEGYSFHLCRNVIFLDYTWAADRMEQGDNRVHRLNSPADVNSYRIICDGTIYRRLESSLAEKSDSAELVLDGKLLGENPAEINLAELLQNAARDFAATGAKTIDESALEKDWPALRDRLERGYKAWSAEPKEAEPTAAKSSDDSPRRSPDLIATKTGPSIPAIPSTESANIIPVDFTKPAPTVPDADEPPSWLSNLLDWAKP